MSESEVKAPVKPVDVEITLDQADAWGFGGLSNQFSVPERGIKMPVDRDSETYNMNHKRSGYALIFNHKNFDPRLDLKTRNGTDADRDNLQMTLRQLDFDVKVYNDFSFKEIEQVLEELANDDHSNADCVLVAVLSHGEMGMLYACDQPYQPARLWSQFNAEKCPTLAGKPKLFFAQACQGDQLDPIVKMTRKRTISETDAKSVSYKIPTHADFLIAYSTIPGDWRTTTAKSSFVQAMCHVLQCHGNTHDLLSNMTRVARKVALDFQPNTPVGQVRLNIGSYPERYLMHEKKPIPSITSMLTRDIIFQRKL